MQSKKETFQKIWNWIKRGWIQIWPKIEIWLAGALSWLIVNIRDMIITIIRMIFGKID